MAPKKKKAPINGYSIFVRETREQYQRKGWYFPKNNQDAFTYVDPLWKKLSDSEKQRYNNQAKEEKRQGASDLDVKFNARGESLADVEANNREIIEYKDIMLNTIQNTVQKSDYATSFVTQKFYLCHVNFYYVNSNERFKPAEIALSEFNLKRGVISTFHAFINPGGIETGYRFDAMKKIEETHQIPIEDPKWVCGERDYVHLFHQVKKFVCKDNPSGRTPPIYTMHDDQKNNFSISAVRSTIETLCEAANEEPSEFRIYELPLLYHEMRQKAMKEFEPGKAVFSTLSMAEHDLEKDKFCFTKGIACQYHEEKDIGNFCSLSVVTRLVYTMCDYLLNFIDVNFVDGGHAPFNSSLAKDAYRKVDTDGFQLVPPLRRPNLSSQASSVSGHASSVRPTVQAQTNSAPKQKLLNSQVGSGSYASAMRGKSATSPVQPGPQSCAPQLMTGGASSYAGVMGGGSNSDWPSIDSAFLSLSQLRLTSSKRTPYLTNEDEDGAYEDADSTLPTPNLSQKTVLSGYTASDSLTQSSCASDMSFGAHRYLGRGRGLQSQATTGNINWALNAGRGAKLKPSNQPRNN